MMCTQLYRPLTPIRSWPHSAMPLKSARRGIIFVTCGFCLPFKNQNLLTAEYAKKSREER